jgi:hypothetical protein
MRRQHADATRTNKHVPIVSTTLGIRGDSLDSFRGGMPMLPPHPPHTNTCNVIARTHTPRPTSTPPPLPTPTIMRGEQARQTDKTISNTKIDGKNLIIRSRLVLCILVKNGGKYYRPTQTTRKLLHAPYHPALPVLETLFQAGP